MQNPHYFLHVGATSPVLPGRGAGMREKTRPAQPLPYSTRKKSRPTQPLQQHFREKTRPASPKTPKLGCFQRAGRTFSRSHPHQAALGELFRARTHIKPRWASFFAHRTRRHGDVETNDTTAATDAGHRETAITTARPSTATLETDNTSATKKHTKNTHLSPAKATPVSTGPPHRPAKATPVSAEARPARAKATRVSRDRSATPARSHGHTPQKTRMQFDWMKFQRSLKTLQFRRSDFRI